jgi:hypothetical protein
MISESTHGGQQDAARNPLPLLYFSRVPGPPDGV